MFGFINQVGYDADGRMGSVAHSTLGEADFNYNNTKDDWLTQLVTGNGASTNYAYDTYGRLTSFDIKNGSGTRLVKHEWSYDNMGRKDASADITVTVKDRPLAIDRKCNFRICKVDIHL